MREKIKIAFQKGEKGYCLQIPIPIVVGLFLFLTIWLCISVFSILKLQDYFALKHKLVAMENGTKAIRQQYSEQIEVLKTTLNQLQQTEKRLQCLLKMGSKEKILEEADLSQFEEGMGEVEDIDIIRKKVEKSLESIARLHDYLKRQRSIYLATPKGFPTAGYISSGYGWRINPITHRREFHHGVDIAAMEGTPVKSTANGIVVYAGRTKGCGNFVVIKHGYGYTTFYAHLRRYIVRIGQWVKRGQIIGYVGHTGLATGSHVHYEVWKHKRRVNPLPYLRGRVKIKG